MSQTEGTTAVKQTQMYTLPSAERPLWEDDRWVQVFDMKLLLPSKITLEWQSEVAFTKTLFLQWRPQFPRLQWSNMNRMKMAVPVLFVDIERSAPSILIDCPQAVPVRTSLATLMKSQDSYGGQPLAENNFHRVRRISYLQWNCFYLKSWADSQGRGMHCITQSSTMQVERQYLVCNRDTFSFHPAKYVASSTVVYLQQSKDLPTMSNLDEKFRRLQ